jgi:GT2 family glycosyltransferase
MAEASRGGEASRGREVVRIADLTILIVSWNVRSLLHRCLSSISEAQDSTQNNAPSTSNLQLRTEIIVVDNASSDGSAEMVSAEFPHVHLVVNDANRGFTAASNQGLTLSHGRYLLLLNPDTEVVGDALATMVGYMDSQPTVGALGPQLRYPDGSRQSSRRRFPTLATALVESTVVQEWWADNIELPLGGIGVLHFMYSEELDWCRRIRDAGWQIVYLPTATVIHHEGKSSEQVVPARHIYFQSSKVRYFRKHHGRLQAGALRWFLLATYVYQAAREGFKWLVGHKRAMREERVKAYFQVLRSGLRIPSARSGGRLR